MERMEEDVNNSEYRTYQQFISNSNWDCYGLMSSSATSASETLDEEKQKKRKPTGYIIDESSHLKKGKASVGVSRQYAGVLEKLIIVR